MRLPQNVYRIPNMGGANVCGGLCPRRHMSSKAIDRVDNVQGADVLCSIPGKPVHWEPGNNLGWGPTTVGPPYFGPLANSISLHWTP